MQTKTIDAQHDLVSIGCLASRVQRSVREIERTSERLGIVAAYRINHVPHFDGRQVERLTAEMRTEEK